jgi:hypothetical protein
MKDFLREVARESNRCEGRCSKTIAEIAASIGVSVRQAQRIAKNAVQRGTLGREDRPGRPSSFWLRSVVLQDKARAAPCKTPILEGMTDMLTLVTRYIGGDGAGRGDTFFSQSKSQLTNNADEGFLLREKLQNGLFEILDIDQERLRNVEKQGARYAELRYEEAGRPQGACELVELLDATIKFLKSAGIRYPKIFLKRLRQIRRGEFVPRRLAGFNTSQDASPETWRGIAGFRNKLRPAIACLWESYTRGMDDIPFHERVRHFLSELHTKQIELEPHEQEALRHLTAPPSQPRTMGEGDTSTQRTSAREADHPNESNDVGGGQVEDRGLTQEKG